jgi:hypothetical protein
VASSLLTILRSCLIYTLRTESITLTPSSGCSRLLFSSHCVFIIPLAHFRWSSYLFGTGDYLLPH